MVDEYYEPGDIKNLKTVMELIEEQGFENLVVKKLLDIENRVTTIESSVSWFKFIAKGGVVLIMGFFGLDVTGVI